MKQTIILFLLLLGALASKSQCVTVNSAFFTNPSGDNTTFSLNINWTAEGTNHLAAYVMSGPDTIYTTCVQVSGIGSGTSIYNGIVSPGGLPTLSATFCRWTGPCGGGVKCAPDQYIPAGGVLDIKFERISARYINSTTTEVTFTIASASGSKTATFNLRMKSGAVKKYTVVMPRTLQAGETWKVTLDHTKGTYTTLKL